MLLLGASNLTVDGVTVFSDHADPNQFWYLPGVVKLARRVQDNEPAFTFIKYKPATVAAGVKGGGFVAFDVNLKLDSNTEARIMSRISGMAPGEARLSAVPFDDGTVKCVALNLDGAGDTAAHAAPPGTFNAVENILGATIPSLWGDEDASFSLTLSQEGATILEQAYRQGTAPIGVIYSFKFTGMRPALDVKITADFKRIYDHFSVSLSGKYYFLRAGIDAAFESLVQDGSIKIEVLNFASNDDAKQKEDWALDFFKSKLLADWFEPTLTPGQTQGGDATTSLDSTTPPTSGNHSTTPGSATPGSTTPGSTTPGSTTPGSTTPGSTTPGSTTPHATTPGSTSPASTPASATSLGSTSPGSTPPTSGATAPGGANPSTPKPAPSGTTPTVRQPARFEITTRDPDPTPSSYQITFTPAATGTQEKLTVTGPGTPTVRIDGTPRTLDSQNQVTVDVAASSTHDLQVEWPAVAAAQDTFELRFAFDRPAESWVAGSPGSNATYQSYLTNHPSPDDDRFRLSPPPLADMPPRGADALHAWLNRLADPKQVSIKGYASYESAAGTGDAVNRYNDRLSGRRVDVARGVVGALAQVATTEARGSLDARMNGRDAREEDRVAKLTGQLAGGRPRVAVSGRLSRPQDQPGPTPPGPNPPGPNPPGPNNPRPTNPGSNNPPAQTQPAQNDGSPEVALKLKYVHQEEQKTLTFEYNRSDTVSRTYAPQGFFGLMLAELADDRKHFVEVDLDDPFFRTFAVTVDADLDFQHIGLAQAHVSIDYGDPSDEGKHKHGDFLFTPSSHAQQMFDVYMNADRDTSYHYTIEYQFDPQSDWDGGGAYSYQLPAKVSEDRALFVNPYEAIGFLEVRVFPRQIDAGVIESVEVHLSHRQSNGTLIAKVLNVAADSQPQLWRIRTDDPKARSYSYYFKYKLKDGTTRQTDPVTTDATALAVNDPFENPIEVDFIPLFDPTQTRMVFIDVHYEDPANNYRRDERLQLQGTTQSDVHLRLSVLDPTKRSFRYRLTFVGVNNQFQRGDYIETSETLIGVIGS